MKKSLIILFAMALFMACDGAQPEMPGGPGTELPNPPGPGGPNGPEPPGQDNPDNGDNSGSEDPGGTGKDDNVETPDVEGDVLAESEFDKVIDIVWSGDEVSVTNGSNLSVTTDGGNVTVGAPGAAGKKVRINLSGKTENGSLTIYNGVKADDTNKKILLAFCGAEISSQKGPAINIQSGKTVYVLLKDGTDNSLEDSANYDGLPEEEDAKACFFSEKQLVFSGNGSLSVSGNFKHAICADDYIHFLGGNVTVKNAVSDGIHAKEYIRMDAGSVKVNSSGEGLQCEDAELGYFYMTGGDLDIATTGEKCGAVETASDLIIEGGKIVASVSGAASKCLKSDNNITISGGELELTTTGTGLYDSSVRDASACACIRAENIFTVRGGNITCTSTGKGGKGINCYKFVMEAPAALNVTTSGSTYTYSSYTCRPKAVKASGGVVIEGGDLTIKTSGTEGEGLESKTTIEINGGNIIIEAKDDGINAAQSITFNGGYTYCYSNSNDGVDSNYNRSGSIVVNGGVVIAHSATGPEEGFDADSHANLTFNGGYVLVTGGQQGGGGGGWRPAPGGGGGWPGGGGGTGATPTCGQPTFLWTSAASVGYFHLTDGSGNVIMSCYVPRALSTSYNMVSAPLTAGASYKCGFTNSAPAGATTVFGKYFYQDGTVSGLNKSFTAPSGYGTI